MNDLPQNKLFAYFGDEIPRLESISLAADTTLVPLDSSGVAYARLSGRVWHHPQEWINSQTDKEIYQSASQLEASWYLPLAKDLTVEGICWPELDREAMVWFWRDALYAKELASKWTSAGIQSVGMLPPLGSPRPMVYYEPSDVVKTALLYYLRERMEYAVGPGAPPVPSPTTFTGTIKNRIQMVARRLLNGRPAVKVFEPTPTTSQPEMQMVARPNPGRIDGTAEQSADSPHCVEEKVAPGSIVFLMHAVEYHRFEQHVQILKETYPDRFVIWLLNGTSAAAERIQSQCQIPVFTCPASRAHTDHSPAFREAWESFLRRIPGSLPFDIQHASLAHFEFYFNSRWPTLCFALKEWRRRWLQANPSMILSTGLEDAETQLPMVAATQLGLANVCVPHGAVYTRKTHLRSSVVLFGNKLSRDAFSHINSRTKLQGCRDLLPNEEYSHKGCAKRGVTGEGLRVLVLLNSPGAEGCLAPYVYVPDHWESLKQLSNIPPEFVGHVSVKFKTHPSPVFGGLDLLKLSVEPNQILSPDTPVSDVLDDFDIFVIFNGYGSVLKPIVTAGKAVILLWPDEKVGAIGPFEMGSALLELGPVMRNVEPFWEFIAEVKSDPGRLSNLESKSRDLAARWFDDTSYPLLIELLKGIKHDGNARRPAYPSSITAHSAEGNCDEHRFS